MNLRDAVEGKEYVVRQIDTEDEDLNAFLFSLGCYSGEHITVVSHLKGGCIVSIKDGRHHHLSVGRCCASSSFRYKLAFANL